MSGPSSSCTSWLRRINQFFERTLGNLGHWVGHRPGYFVIVPPLIAVIFALSFRTMSKSSNELLGFLPQGRRSQTDRATIVPLLPIGYPFDPHRVPTSGYHAQIIFRARDGGSMWRPDVWDAVVKLDTVVRSFVTAGNVSFLSDCARTRSGACWRNDLFEASDQIAKGVQLTYPRFVHPVTKKELNFAGQFGFGRGERQSVVVAVKAMYFLSYMPQDDAVQKSYTAWEEMFGKVMTNFSSPLIEALWFTATEDTKEGDRTSMATIPLIGLSMILVLIYCLLATLGRDWVRSKPFVALFGVISAGLGTTIAFGICVYAGVLFRNLNLAIPFLMLGIGMDDTFVMLAAWRRTSIRDSVPERMRETYSEAAVSLLISSLTDVISYWIGSLTPFQAVETFCIYSGTSVMILYVCHLTFFGGILAISGYCEAGNRHSVTCVRIPAASEAHGESSCFQLFCTGGKAADGSDAKLVDDEGTLATDAFFRDIFGAWLCNPFVKALVVIIYGVYIFGGIYGILFRLDQGLDKKSIVGVGSLVWKFYDANDEIFYTYPYKIQVVIAEPLNYSNSSTRETIFQMLTKLENVTHIGERSFTDFWLDSFLRRISDPGDPLYGSDISTEPKFIMLLKKFLAESKNEAFVLDVKFSGDGPTEVIQASRLMLQAKDVKKTFEGAQLMQELRKICDSAPFKMISYTELDDLYDQSLLVLPTTLQDAGIAAVVMLCVALIMIPNPVSGFVVMATIFSIEVGVMGYMALWGVNLDPISMICVVMCIGFSVEFATHVSHAYVTVQVTGNQSRIPQAMHNVGTPILQGAASMILAIAPMAFSPSYIFVTFFKITVLVTVFGMAHGLALLPIVMSLLDCSGVLQKSTCCSCEEPDTLSQLDASKLGPGSDSLRKRFKKVEKEPEIFFVSRKTQNRDALFEKPDVNWMTRNDPRHRRDDLRIVDDDEPEEPRRVLQTKPGFQFCEPAGSLDEYLDAKSVSQSPRRFTKYNPRSEKIFVTRKQI